MSVSGIWAPGIRLFRHLGFKSKALIISGAFLVPIVVLGVFFLHSEQQDLSFTHAERAGVAYARPLLSLLEASTRERQLASAMARGDVVPEMASAQQASRAAQAALEQQHAVATSKGERQAALRGLLEQRGHVVYIEFGHRAAPPAIRNDPTSPRSKHSNRVQPA